MEMCSIKVESRKDKREMMGKLERESKGLKRQMRFHAKGRGYKEISDVKKWVPIAIIRSLVANPK
jgi:hypothetical protein